MSSLSRVNCAIANPPYVIWKELLVVTAVLELDSV